MTDPWAVAAFVGFAVCVWLAGKVRAKGVVVTSILLNGKEQLDGPMRLGENDSLRLSGRHGSDVVELRLGAPEQPKQPWWERMNG